jgi:hypothetical protein
MSNVELSLQERRKIFIEHLESGNYQQTQGVLRDYKGHCCLGVACVIYDKINGYDSEENWYDGGHMGSVPQVPSESVRSFFKLDEFNVDLDRKFVDVMWRWNDQDYLTFVEIAAKLRTLWNIPKE